MTGNITPRKLPQTPPSSTRKGFLSKPIPKFNLPDVTPTENAGANTNQAQLRTPTTIKGKAIDGSSMMNFPLTEGTTLFLPSPSFTPQRSPRNRRKKLTLENIFPPQESISSLFPKHGSIGSGRKYQGPSKLESKGFSSLDPAELFELNENLGFEEDLDFEEDLPESPTKFGRNRKLAPTTPGKQLITEEKIRSWHGNSYRSGFSSDEEDFDSEVFTSAKLANPFVESHTKVASGKAVSFNSRKINPFAPKEHVVNYDTHMELVNHRTGERKIQLLSEEQRKFKPKKLDFSNV